MQEARKPPFTPGQWWKKALFALALAVGLTLVALFSLTRIKKARAQSRINELLPEFEQVSDKFTRPKVFLHKSFKAISGEGHPKHFVYRMSAHSDGALRMPELLSTDISPDYRRYTAVINLNENIFRIDSGNAYNEMRVLLDQTASLPSDIGIALAVRIEPSTWASKIQKGDYSIEGDELKAFMKTMELTYLFKVVAE